MSTEKLMELIYSLVGFPSETEWIEFKDSNKDPLSIGKDISALSNSAAFLGRDRAYKLWGIDDGTHELIGTSFNPLSAKAKGNQSLLIWLKTMLSSNANYQFDTVEHGGKAFVVLTVFAPSDQPVYFENVAYIREGSSTTKLAAGSAKEAELWRRLQRIDFESRIALEDVAENEIYDLLNVEAYFDLLSLKRPSGVGASLVPLLEQEIIRHQDNGRLAITNLGALLISRSMSAFPGLKKRAIRIIRFAGKGNFDIIEDREINEGYATALPKAEEYIMSAIPAQEYSDGAFRRLRYAYPQPAVRELLSNCAIHQDLAITSAGPLVQIYQNRIVFSNPGASLIPPNRVLNAQPKTRNNMLAGILRQMDLCEEGGTGWDRAVAACEAVHISAPRIESDEELGTKVTLFQGLAYERMTKAERLDALYWHACLMYEQGESFNNQSLRLRFGLPDAAKNTVAMSRLIREACDLGIIKEEDEGAGAKFKRYIPAWA